MKKMKENIYSDLIAGTDVEVFLSRNVRRMDDDTVLGLLMDKYGFDFETAEKVLYSFQNKGRRENFSNKGKKFKEDIVISIREVVDEYFEGDSYGALLSLEKFLTIMDQPEIVKEWLNSLSVYEDEESSEEESEVYSDNDDFQIELDNPVIEPEEDFQIDLDFSDEYHDYSEYDLEVDEDIILPGTDIVLEKGDRIRVL